MTPQLLFIPLATVYTRRASLKKPQQLLFRRLFGLALSIALVASSFQLAPLATGGLGASSEPVQAIENSLLPSDDWTLDRLASPLPPADSGAISAASGGATWITAGYNQTCAVIDGIAKCWGANAQGELGSGGYYYWSVTPVDVFGQTGGVVSVEAGQFHACALVADRIECWGLNNYGQLGVSGKPSSSVPVTVTALAGSGLAIAAGDSHTCWISGSGGVKCWGLDNLGQLGNGGANSTGPAPVDVSGLATGVRAVAAGASHNCAITASREVKCWGSNSQGQLGRNMSGGYSDTPANVINLTAGVVAIDAGNAHSCAVDEGGAVSCWGSNWLGQLGAGLPDSQSILPVSVVGLDQRVKAVATGGNHSCALMDADGTVKCWGDNRLGQLGAITSGTQISVPVEVGGLSGVVQVVAGDNHTCALLADGEVKCWGRNDLGQLGDGTRQNRSQPVPVVGLLHGVSGQVATASGSKVPDVRISAGALNDTTDADGSYAIGDLVSGTYTLRPSKPGYTFTPAFRTVAVPPSAAGQNFTATVAPIQPIANGLTAGADHTCTIVDGSARCWGAGDYGQLGNGTTGTSSGKPLDVVGLSNGVIAVEGGAIHTCANTASILKCWGANADKQVGPSTDAKIGEPMNLSSLGSVVAVAAGGRHTCADKGLAGVLCWGFDFSGQLGDGSVDHSGASPVPVTGLDAPVEAISAGFNQTSAITPTRSVACWGDNGFGQLGANSVGGNAKAPVAVFDLSGASAIDAGRAHTCAVAGAGEVKCWGDNAFGKLGAGLPGANSGRPVAVGLGTPAEAIAAGSDHTCALLAGSSVWCWGSNAYGQLGVVTTTTAISVPVEVSLLGGMIIDLAAGDNHTCAFLIDGSVSCWGRNNRGQLGDGTRADRWQPAPVADLLYSVEGVVAEPSGNPIEGVIISAGGSLTATTDGSGSYVLGDLRAGAHVITPTKPGYSFLPVTNTVTVPPAAQRQGFTARRTLSDVDLWIDLHAPGCVGRGDGNPTRELIELKNVGLVGLSAVTVTAEIASNSPGAQPDEMNEGSGVWRCNDTRCVSYPFSLAPSETRYLDFFVNIDTSVDWFTVGVTISDDGSQGPDRYPSDNYDEVWTANLHDEICWSCGVVWLASFLQTQSAQIERWRGLAQGAGAVLLDINTYRRFRDEVLMATPSGQRYVRLYYDHSPGIIRALAANPDLAGETAAVLQAWEPSMVALLNGQGSTATISTSQAQALDTYLDHLYVAASPALKEVIVRERAMNPPGALVGKSLNEVRAQVVGHTVYVPLVARSYGGGTAAGW